MTKFEMFLVVFACLAPIIAILFVVPKGFRFKKKPKVELKQVTPEETFSYLPEQQEKKEPVELKEKEKKVTDLPFDKVEFSSDDFKGYLNRRDENKVPKFMQDDMFDPLDIVNPVRRKKEEPKQIKEQIQDLSPELKAILIAGVLDRKNFDE